MINQRRRRITLENLKLSSPQRLSVAQLLTSQKNKYKKLLHETHERLHIIADLTDSLEFWYNVSGHYEHISSNCLKITGYNREEFLHRQITLEQLIHPDSLNLFLSDRKQSLKAIAGDERLYKFIHKSGEVRWALASWYPVFTRKEKHIGIRISITDITPQKQFEAHARNYKRLYGRLLEIGGTVGAISLDVDGSISSWNEVAEKLTGFKEKELLGKSFAEIHKDPKHAEFLSWDLAFLKSDLPNAYSTTLKAKSGGPLKMDIVFTPMFNADEQVQEIMCFLTLQS